MRRDVQGLVNGRKSDGFATACAWHTPRFVIADMDASARRRNSWTRSRSGNAIHLWRSVPRYAAMAQCQACCSSAIIISCQALDDRWLKDHRCCNRDDKYRHVRGFQRSYRKLLRKSRVISLISAGLTTSKEFYPSRKSRKRPSICHETNDANCHRYIYLHRVCNAHANCWSRGQSWRNGVTRDPARDIRRNASLR